MTKKKRNYWTEETIIEAAKGFKGRKEFKRKFGGAYWAASKLGILEEIFPEILPSHPKILTKELFLETSKKYNSLAEFRKENFTLCNKAYMMGWMKEAPWLKKNTSVDLEKKLWCVYVYEIKETGHAYVGLSRVFKQRNGQHKNKRKKKDSVFEYCDSLGISVPDPIILETDLTGKEAQEAEKKYVDQYRGEGWNMINFAKPGSLGGGIKMWTLERCIEVCKTVHSTLELRKQFCGALGAIEKYGWQEKCYSHFLPKFTLYKVSPEGFVVKGYKTKKDAAKDMGIAYTTWRRNYNDSKFHHGFYWKTADELFAD